MSNKISRRNFLHTAGLGTLGAAAAGLLTACGDKAASGSVASSAAAGTYTAGTYSATATGINTTTPVTVTMTFSADAITDVQIDVANETKGYGADIADEMVKKILDAQSSEVDGHSGATITSDAIKKAAESCNKKTVQKDWLEDLVVRETMKLIQDDAVIDKIVQLVMDVQNQENTTIPLLEKQLREVNKKLDNLMKAIEDGLYTRTTKERLEALEIQKDELTAKIADEKLKKPSFNEDFIRFWLLKFRKFDISQQKQRKALIEIFVNAIFLYDDRILITFNYKDGTQTVRFEDTLTADSAEEKSSDLSSLAGP